MPCSPHVTVNILCLPCITTCNLKLFYLLQSNEWAGKSSFGGSSLHAVGEAQNPYEGAFAWDGG